MGVTLRERGCLADALHAYEAAYVLAPGNNVVRTNLAIALTDMGEWGGAVAVRRWQTACAYAPQADNLVGTTT